MIVGAPYDGPDHKGAIYVYLGSSERKASGQWKYAQVPKIIIILSPLLLNYSVILIKENYLMIRQKSYDFR